jgi:hypothetical protein
MQFSAWYTEDQFISKSGEPKHYQSPNNDTDYMFCPNCGSTVYWEIFGLEAHFKTRLFGIAVGNFANPDYPRPEVECWSSKRHRWLGDLGSDEVALEWPASVMEMFQSSGQES